MPSNVTLSVTIKRIQKDVSIRNKAWKTGRFKHLDIQQNCSLAVPHNRTESACNENIGPNLKININLRILLCSHLFVILPKHYYFHIYIFIYTYLFITYTYLFITYTYLFIILPKQDDNSARNFRALRLETHTYSISSISGIM